MEYISLVYLLPSHYFERKRYLLLTRCWQMRKKEAAFMKSVGHSSIPLPKHIHVCWLVMAWAKKLKIVLKKIMMRERKRQRKSAVTNMRVDWRFKTKRYLQHLSKTLLQLVLLILSFKSLCSWPQKGEPGAIYYECHITPWNLAIWVVSTELTHCLKIIHNSSLKRGTERNIQNIPSIF